MIERAKKWRSKHKVHVDYISADGKLRVPPSGEDMPFPQLWKGCHWRWFADYCDE